MIRPLRETDLDWALALNASLDVELSPLTRKGLVDIVDASFHARIAEPERGLLIAFDREPDDRKADDRGPLPKAGTADVAVELARHIRRPFAARPAAPHSLASERTAAPPSSTVSARSPGARRPEL